MELFTDRDFRIFDLSGFSERMAAIAGRIRPKLTSIGEELAPKLSAIVDRPLYVHVARHARRTVNPPDDTWAAFGADPRGYKKDVHFKVAVSRHCVRLLFEVGPEYFARPEWAAGWKRAAGSLANDLRRNKSLAWFRNEHDEDPAAWIRALTDAELRGLGGELIRRRDGQFVLGRRIDAEKFVELTPKKFEKLAIETFTPLGPLFTLCEPRRAAAEAPARMAARV